MRIAVSADDPNGLDAVVSPHFGRCPYYILVDVEEGQITSVHAIENPYFNQHAPGVVPEFIRQQSVDVMLTGGMGRRAVALFEQFGIEPVTGASGTVRHALSRYLSGELAGAVPCRESRSHARHETSYERDAIGRLREEADMLREQLEHIERRLNQLLS
ncbi:MAG TPA: dinitrogenase iron-molybdenum cofactor biosynthesis protein [Caldilineae bacterium]|nr:dinitrogenase iron-molybdenum cofactor biosynthesis protein [Caldilineae bacterium]